MCVHVPDRETLGCQPLAKFTYLQTEKQTDMVASYISTHAKFCLTEWEAGLVVMLTSPPGRPTDKQSHDSSLQLSSVCYTLCERKR